MKTSSHSTIRVRFAPSPTGLLHVGSFRTALFNWLFAKKYGGKFILRIEDTDQTRSREEFLRSQLADLKWMGLHWDEGPDIGGDFAPYSQMQRLETYRTHAEKLLKEGKAYYCYCTPEELEKERTESARQGKEVSYSGKCRKLAPDEALSLAKEGRSPCLRFHIPFEGETVIDDLVKGRVVFENKYQEDFVIVKSDGVPTYNFAVVVDDHLMQISHVIRGDEHMSNTPRQAALYDAFGYEKPVFCHIPIILNPDKTKLSKRKGAVHLLEFRDKGYLREALLNFLALLGWAPKDNREIMSMEELVEAFSIEGITRHPAVFDENKLSWMNGQYISTLPVDEIIVRLKVFIEKTGVDPELKNIDWYRKAVNLYRERVKTMVEFAENLEYFFKEIDDYDPDGVKKHFKHPFLVEALPELAGRIECLESFAEENLETALRDYAGEINQSAGKLIHAVRLAISGKTVTPPIFDVMVLLGKPELVQRIRKTAGYIEKYQQSQAVSPMQS
jgi:nondiscriminating glutamyl-tRNA synthetase